MRLCKPLLAMGMWSLQFEDLHNTSATSEKLTGRFAACHDRFVILIDPMVISANPQALGSAKKGWYLLWR